MSRCNVFVLCNMYRINENHRILFGSTFIIISRFIYIYIYIYDMFLHSIFTILETFFLLHVKSNILNKIHWNLRIYIYLSFDLPSIYFLLDPYHQKGWSNETSSYWKNRNSIKVVSLWYLFQMKIEAKVLLNLVSQIELRISRDRKFDDFDNWNSTSIEWKNIYIWFTSFRNINYDLDEFIVSELRTMTVFLKRRTDHDISWDISLNFRSIHDRSILISCIYCWKWKDIVLMMTDLRRYDAFGKYHLLTTSIFRSLVSNRSMFEF